MEWQNEKHISMADYDFQRIINADVTLSVRILFDEYPITGRLIDYDPAAGTVTIKRGPSEDAPGTIETMDIQSIAWLNKAMLPPSRMNPGQLCRMLSEKGFPYHKIMIDPRGQLLQRIGGQDESSRAWIVDAWDECPGGEEGERGWLPFKPINLDEEIDVSMWGWFEERQK